MSLRNYADRGAAREAKWNAIWASVTRTPEQQRQLELTALMRSELTTRKRIAGKPPRKSGGATQKGHVGQVSSVSRLWFVN